MRAHRSLPLCYLFRTTCLQMTVNFLIWILHLLITVFSQNPIPIYINVPVDCMTCKITESELLFIAKNVPKNQFYIPMAISKVIFSNVWLTVRLLNRKLSGYTITVILVNISCICIIINLSMFWPNLLCFSFRTWCCSIHNESQTRVVSWHILFSVNIPVWIFYF